MSRGPAAGWQQRTVQAPFIKTVISFHGLAPHADHLLFSDFDDELIG